MTETELKAKMTEFYKETDQYYTRLIGHFEELEQNGLKLGSIDILKLAKTGQNILDCGCGSGSFCIYLNKKIGANTYGVDISDVGIDLAKDLAKKANTNCEFKVADIENLLPFPDNFFDLILMHEVLEHLVFPEKSIKECTRVLKPGGLFVLVGPNLFIRASLPQMIKKVPQWIKMAFDKDYVPKTLLNPKFDVSKADSDAVYLTNPIELRRILKLCGLKITRGSFIRCMFIAQKVNEH